MRQFDPLRREWRVDNPHECTGGRRHEPAGGAHEPPVKQGRQRSAPEQAGDDEAVGQFANGLQGDGRLRVYRLAAHHLIERNGDQLGECRQRRERQSSVMAHGRGAKRLRRDFQADEHEDGEHRRLGQPLEDMREPTEVSGSPDEERRSQRVGRPAAHRLVGRMTNVRRRLDDTAEAAGGHGGDPFSQQDRPRVVFVSGSRRAFRTVDASHDRRHSERQSDRQPRQGAEPHLLRPVKPALQIRDEHGRLPSRRFTGGLQRRHNRPAGQLAQMQACVVAADADQNRSERPRYPARQRSMRNQRYQDNCEGEKPDHRHVGDVQRQRQECNQHQGDGRQRAEQTGARHPAANGIPQR